MIIIIIIIIIIIMARWGSSALVGSLSSDGVTIKILVVIQPYTYQPFL